MNQMIGVIIGFGLFFSISNAHAYKLLEIDWRHQSQPIVNSFSVCMKGAPPGAAQIIKDAARKWNYAKFQFSFSADNCANNSTANYAEFGSIADPGKTAQTDTPNEPGTNRMKRCYVRFNVAKSWYVGAGSPSSMQNDLFSVALHEFGHCVGLADVSTPGVAMHEILPPGQTHRNLAPDDIAGREKIYGAP